MKLIKYGSVLALHRCCKRYCSGIQMYSRLPATLQERSLYAHAQLITIII